MTNALFILVLIVGPLLAFVVVLTLPRWFARSLHGHRMWRLRDAVVDDVLAGDLSRDHKAVQHLIGIMDAVLNSKHVALLDVYIVRRVSKDADPAFRKLARNQGLACPLDGLSPPESQRIEAYRERFMTLLAGSMLLGSWFGIAHILPFVPAGVREAIRQARAATRDGFKHRLNNTRGRFEREITVSAREATDLAAVHAGIAQTAVVFATHHEVNRPSRQPSGVL